MTPKIALITDFGEYDPFVGIMKGVISEIAPRTNQIDITHLIPPGDIKRGAIVLWQCYQHFPQETVFLTVVDPGVGTDRKAIYLQAHGHTFIGPDNGVFSYLLDDNYQAWELTNTRLQYETSSTTFHGRDIFAPAAAHASLGVEGPEFGNEVTGLTRFPHPRLHKSGAVLHGEVLTIDQFGNLLTSLGRFRPSEEGDIALTPWTGSLSPQRYQVESLQVQLPDGITIPLVKTFDDLEGEECGALVGSTGLIEVVANQQSAADLLELHPGDPVQLIDRGQPLRG